MFIVWAKQIPPAPFEGAELKLTSTHLATLRSFERRCFFVMSKSINIPLLRSEDHLLDDAVWWFTKGGKKKTDAEKAVVI